jgi:hypothetical protein
VLADILRQAAGEPGTFVVSGACAPQAQEKLFKKVLHSPPPIRFGPWSAGTPCAAARRGPVG